MLNVNKIAEECKKELDALGIKYGRFGDIKINTRAKRRWGNCKKVPGGYEISISDRLLKSEKTVGGLKEVVMHEIIHTCEGCLNHGDKWKEIASIVNKKYGYNIKRTCSAEEVGAEQLPEKTYNHKVVCTGCGREVFRMRECSITINPHLWKCGVCGSKFKRMY